MSLSTSLRRLRGLVPSQPGISACCWLTGGSRMVRSFSTVADANHIQNKITGPLVDTRKSKGDIKVDMYAELPHTFGPADVRTFAQVCGDDNPLHLDDDYARKQGIFKGAIVHGILVGSLFSTIFGVTFPGSVYLQQSFKFSRPVYVGSSVTARVEVTRIRPRDSSPPSLLVYCSTHVIDSEGAAAIAGEAVVLIPTDTRKDAEEGPNGSV